MQARKPVLTALLVAVVAGGGLLYAQPGDEPDLPEVTAPGGTDAQISPREIRTETERLLTEMEGVHVRILQLQDSARKAKDVIKLNCVNDKLLAIKQLLNIADSARTDLTESIATGDRAAQLHEYSQIKLAHERAVAERDDAEGCIGEEIVFIGPTEINVTGPRIVDDPTDDGDDPFGPFPDGSIDFERAAYASPFH
jgi:hypothetical protein